MLWIALRILLVKHYLMSISLNSMSKYRTRILPSVLGYLEEKGKLPKILTLGLAAYVVFYRGLRGEEAIALNDSEDILNLYKELWKDFDGSKENVDRIVQGVLGYEALWQNDLNQVPYLTETVSNQVVAILEKGMKAVVEEVI